MRNTQAHMEPPIIYQYARLVGKAGRHALILYQLAPSERGLISRVGKLQGHNHDHDHDHEQRD